MWNLKNKTDKNKKPKQSPRYREQAVARGEEHRVMR